MPLQIRAFDADHPSDLLDLEWHLPLEQWSAKSLVALPRGISRHVVRFARAGDEVVAVKEVSEWAAVREYGLLRDLDRLGIPGVDPIAVVTGRVDADGGALEPALVTRHLNGSLPYRSMFETTMRPGRSTGCWTRSRCCWCGCTWWASRGATARCPTPSSAGTRAPTPRIWWTPRPGRSSRS